MSIDLDELKQAAPLPEYVKNHYSGRIKIVEDNSNVLKAYCPWHEDKDSPSLALFNNGTFKCFGGDCNKSGDVIQFVQNMENLPFQEACKLIGSNVGYPINLTPLNPHHELYKNYMDDTSRRYWYNFQGSQVAKDYMMNKRGLSEETLNMFRIGVTSVDEYKYRKDMGGISNRISFPILENNHYNYKCIAMGYRALKDEKPKYINDSNKDGREGQDPNISGVFTKGHVLYGYPMAYKAIKEKNFAILVEGYIDVLSLHQSNIKNVVSTMGLSISQEQINKIKQITDNVMLILDPDKAGIKAVDKILPLLMSNGLNPIVCVLKNGLDPADLCLNNGFNNSKIYREISSCAVPGGKFLIDNVVTNYENKVIIERQKALKKAMPTLNAMTNQIDKDIYMDLLYKRLDLK